MADPENLSDCDDSDNSDEDYVPIAKNGQVSEEENSGDAESDLEEPSDAPKSKRRRKNKPIDEKSTATVEQTSKLDVDAIWADFQKDTQEEEKRLTVERKPVIASPATVKPSLPAVPTSSKNLVSTPVVGKSNTGGGLASILGKLGKKDKLSTLEKSRMDWNSFKQAEGIDEDLKKHNKGRDGFLERRDFLERTDMRLYELEKQMRSVKRSSR